MQGEEQRGRGQDEGHLSQRGSRRQVARERRAGTAPPPHPSRTGPSSGPVLTCSLLMSSGGSPSTIGVPLPFPFLPFFLGAWVRKGSSVEWPLSGFLGFLAGSLGRGVPGLGPPRTISVLGHAESTSLCSKASHPDHTHSLLTLLEKQGEISLF